MHIVTKWIITILVTLFIGYVYGSHKANVPYWIAPLFASALFGIWLMKDPNKKKKEISFQRQKRKRKIENIFLLTIVALIIIMIMLKFTIP
jgi:accessory gene regulator protein AgrB